MRDFIKTICGRAFALWLCTALLGLTSCLPAVPLVPVAGVPEYQRRAVIELGHASVNTAGGNLIFELRPMIVDTPLGPQSFGATYNAADGDWTWSYYGLFYDGHTFVDPTGHHNSLDYAKAYGRLMPSNRNWMPLSSRRMKTAGGIIYEFDADTDRLESIYRSSANYPRIQVAPNEIQQCSAVSVCDTLFEIVRDGAGRITIVKDRPGPEQRTAQFAYDGAGRLVVARSAGDVEAGRSGFRLGYSLLASKLLTSTLNSENEEVEYSYDFSRRITHAKLVGAGDPTTQLAYGNVDALAFTRVIDPLGNERVYRHDGYRQLRQSTDGEGWTTSYEWTGFRLARMTTPAGIVTRWVHAEDSSIQIMPSGNEVSTTYLPTAVNLQDPWSQAVLEIGDLDDQGASRAITQNGYDSAGLLTSTTDANGDTVTYGYDNGLLLVAYVPNPSGGTPIALLSDYHGTHGHPTEVGYSAYGAPFTETQTFTSAGDPTSGPAMDHSEAEGRPNIRLLHYDDDRNLAAIDYGTCFIDPQTQGCSITQTNPDEGTTTITRRSDGRPLLISRPLGNDSQFVYDAIGQLQERKDRIDGVWQSTSIAHDLAARVSAVASPNGMRVDYEYDMDGRRTKSTWTKPGAAAMVRELNHADGRIVSVLDSTRGGLQTIEYDSAGRPSASNYPSGERLELSYDGRGLETQRRFIFPDGSENVLETERDPAGRWKTRKLDGVTFAEQERVGDLRRKLSFGQGGARIERESLYASSEGGRMVATTTRDALGSILEYTDILQADGFDYTQTRVSSSIELSSGTASINEILWERDEQAADVGPKVFGEGEYEVIPGVLVPQQVFDYDALGNRIHPAISFNTDNTRLASAFGLEYSSDASGYVDRIDDLGADTSTVIVRNAQGRAIEIQQTGQNSILIDRDARGLPLTNMFGGLVELGPLATRTLDLGDVRLALHSGGCHLGRYFDLRGNVRFTVDLCTGLPQKALEYGAYGVVAEHGSDGDDRGFAQGRELAPDLVLIGARLYRPSLGRFLSPDPVFQRGGQFAYAEGNPLQLWDPHGETIFIAVIGAVALIVAAWGAVVLDHWLEDQEEGKECECGGGSGSGSTGAGIAGGGNPATPVGAEASLF